MKISKEIKVALFAISAIVLFYFGFNFLKGIDFFKGIKRYYAVYENVDKLMPSNPVYIKGYSVGRISDIVIVQSKGTKVLVVMEIDSDITLGKGAKAMLSGDFLLGNKYLMLEVGDVSQPLQAGDTLFSEIDKGLADLMAQAGPVAGNLQSTIAKLGAVLDNLEKNTAKLDQLFIGLAATPKILNQTLTTVNGSVGQLSNKYATLSETLNERIKGLDPTLQNFKTLSDSLKSVELNTTLKKIQQTLAALNSTLSKTEEGEKNTVSKLLNDDELYVNLNKLLLNLDGLVKHFDSNPKHFLSPLGKGKKKVEKDLNKEKSE